MSKVRRVLFGALALELVAGFLWFGDAHLLHGAIGTYRVPYYVADYVIRTHGWTKSNDVLSYVVDREAFVLVSITALTFFFWIVLAPGLPGLGTHSDVAFRDRHLAYKLVFIASWLTAIASTITGLLLLLFGTNTALIVVGIVGLISFVSMLLLLRNA